MLKKRVFVKLISNPASNNKNNDLFTLPEGKFRRAEDLVEYRGGLRCRTQRRIKENQELLLRNILGATRNN